MKKVFIFLLIAFSITACRKNVIFLKDVTDSYSIQIDIDSDSSMYDGPAKITLIDNQTQEEIQTFKSDLFVCHLVNGKPSVNTHESVNEMSPLFIDDFNFDGHLDIAISNGAHPTSRKPFFDVYLYNTDENKYQINKDLSLLTQYNNGVIAVDAQKQRVTTQISKGCCVTEYSEYEMKENIPILTYKRTENLVGDTIEIVVDELVDGEWVRVIRNESQTD